MLTLRRTPFALLGVVVFAALAHAQGPELKKLGYFIGNWHGTLQAKEGMFAPAGAVATTIRSEWMPGEMFMRSNVEERTPSGTVSAFSITGFDKEKKVYVEYDFDGHGDIERTEGTLTGDTWTWLTQYTMNGKPVRVRSIVKPMSETSCDYTVEMSTNGGDWQTVRQGTLTKTP